MTKPSPNASKRGLGTLTRGHDNQWYHRWQRDERYSLVFLHPSVGKRDAFGLAESLIEDCPQSQLIEQGTNSQDRPPCRGIEDVGVFVLGGSGVDILPKQAFQLGK